MHESLAERCGLNFAPSYRPRTRIRLDAVTPHDINVKPVGGGDHREAPIKVEQLLGDVEDLRRMVYLTERRQYRLRT